MSSASSPSLTSGSPSTPVTRRPSPRSARPPITGRSNRTPGAVSGGNLPQFTTTTVSLSQSWCYCRGMADEELLTIDELAAGAGLTVRTVRFYATKGLLPAPVRRGRIAYYGPVHRVRLDL